MKTYVCALVAILLCSSLAMERGPKVEVYTRIPGEFGKANFLICHVSQFFPPLITIELLRDGVEMAGGNQKDVVFETDWQYHLTKSVPFTPNKGEKFSCRVTHMQKPRIFNWESDM